MRIFSKRAEEIKSKDVEQKEGGGSEDALLRASLGGEAIGTAEAMNIPAFSACVNKIAETVSTIPIKLYKREGEEIIEVIGDKRTMILNVDTGDALNAVEFKRAIVRDYLMGKGGYAYIEKKGKKFKALYYVEENKISFMYNQDPIFKEYDITIQGTSYKPYEFLKILRNTTNGREGKSIVEECGKILSVAYNSLKYEENLVKTGGNKKGFIRSPKKLADAAMVALRNAWRNLYQNNDENVVILNEGLEFKESSNTSVEMQLNENKKTNSDEICKIINMPPSIINGGATEQDKTEYAQRCILPILKEFECALGRDFLLESEKELYFYEADMSELIKGDMEKRFRAYKTASEAGFMQIDEIRKKENMKKLGLNFIKLGLQDVLYDPTSGTIYTPNMGKKSNINDNAEMTE